MFYKCEKVYALIDYCNYKIFLIKYFFVNIMCVFFKSMGIFLLENYFSAQLQSSWYFECLFCLAWLLICFCFAKYHVESEVTVTGSGPAWLHEMFNHKIKLVLSPFTCLFFNLHWNLRVWSIHVGKIVYQFLSTGLDGVI